ncbi:MAG: hypothetical protein A4E62_02041 [Syntrophorhabdus sp. PtaU1.Bin002]|nr:MAG: hypothetical protein A4E62_02041 [Syntrophorhabdus sp. PtaU1.Bin002]
MQPVPWISRRIRFFFHTVVSLPSKRMSVGSPWRCPPFTTTALGPALRMAFPHATMSSGVLTVFPRITEASSKFGVTTVALGKIDAIRVFKPVSVISLLPFFAATMGSMTTGVSLLSGRRFERIFTWGSSRAAPILTPFMLTSPRSDVAIARNCPSGMGYTSLTPFGPCTTIHVGKDSPWRPREKKMPRSCVMPAPEV